MSLFHRNRKYSSPSVPNQSTAPQDLTPETFVYPGQSAGSADLDSFVYAPDQPASRQGTAKGESTPPADLSDLDLEARYEVDFEAQRRLMHRNIKRVAAVILAMFIGLMSYLGYFQVTRAESLRTDAGNRRNAEARNKVLRGSIFDRSGKVLSRSVLHEDGTQTREYPGGEPYGNILGYVSAKYSVTGLESTMDQILSKQPGVDELLTLDFLSSLLNPEEGVTKKQVGQSLHLTLDSGLQKAAYEAMDGRKGSVVALDPRTGEILAMVSSPGFSAARLDEVMKKVNSDKDYAATAPLINRAVNSVFAPGSTMKTITLAAGLEYLPGLRERVFEDKGYIEFPDGSRLNNFNNNVYGEMNLQSAFTNSSNYIFGSLGIELTNEQLRRTAEALGFNQPIEMQGLKARKSVFPTLGEYAKGDKALTAIGQGAVAATPLQMAMVAAAVANDGQLAAPALISQITDKDGKVVSQAGEPVLTQALSQEVAATVKAMMIQNVKSGGSSYRSLDRNSGAGKTGTAQFEVSDGTRVHAWFIGFAPQKNPRIAFAVVMEDLADVKENTGAQQAIPVVRDLLNYWNSH